MADIQYPTIGTLLPEPVLSGIISEEESISGNVSTDKALEIPYKEINNLWGIEIQIG